MTLRRRALSVVAALAVAVGAVACASSDTADPEASATAPTASGTAASGGPTSTIDSEALRAARAFTDALNRGDRAAAEALLTPAARFDSVGRVYPDRDAIFDRFLDPEVIAVGGQYAERDVRTEGDRLVVAYDFTTRSGGRETFTYAYQVRGGLITDVIGRYV